MDYVGLKDLHTEELKNLTLEVYGLNERRQQIETRISEINIIFATLDAIEETNKHEEEPEPE